MEFAYNNAYQASFGIAPYEALYGRRCRTLVCWKQVDIHIHIYRYIQKHNFQNSNGCQIL